MNLLERFMLQHVQVTVLHAEVLQAGKKKGKQEAKIELNLAPRLLQTDSGDRPPAYQVTAQLTCRSGPVSSGEPAFKAQVGLAAVYQQVAGEAVDIAEFTANHASLTRQLYPLLQQELRVLMARLGVEDIRLPFDLGSAADSAEHRTVEISGAVH